jgi:Tol biopolymer transport system component
MPLAIGQRLGPYEIVAAIGAGGMGEVYKAKDTRLDRIVAIKVMPASSAADPEFRARFEREARTISQLSHPHICALFDVGNQDGVEFLVMEHLEGETLADRLKKGPVPVEQALGLAEEIADALDKAHRMGIVHRDLKPANIMLTKAGSKLLDFGLAKMSASAVPGTIETRLLTSVGPAASADPLTARGTILGTFQYMSPEQLEGKDADTRSDIWAFGCVLYEMVTGKRTFEGKTQASLIAAILEREPAPMAELVPLTPPALGRLVRTCLAKDPDDRFQTAHDLGLQLKWIDEGGSAAGLPAPVIAKRKRRELAMWIGIAAAAALVAAAAAWLLKPEPVVKNVVSRFSYPLPGDQIFTRVGRHGIAISPDGTKIAYVANQQIYLRSLDQLDAQPVRGTSEDPFEIVFSPDGQSIAYFVPSGTGAGSTVLKKIGITGGAPVPLVKTTSAPYGVSWRAGTIAFGQRQPGIITAIQTIPDSGGTPQIIFSVDEKKETVRQPQLLDDGAHLLVSVQPQGAQSQDDSDIVLVTIASGERRVLVHGGTDGHLLSSGHLVYIREATLLAVAVDMKRLETSGGPVSVVEGVNEVNASGAGQFAVAGNGTLVFAPGSAASAQRTPVWVDRKGKETPIPAKPRAYRYARLSPDGKQFAIDATDEDYDIWIWDFARESPSRLTFGPARDQYPLWTRDSHWVIYQTLDSDTSGGIFRRAADGNGGAETLLKDGINPAPTSLSPDGKLLVYTETGPGTGQDVMLLPLDPAGPAKPLLHSRFDERNADVSPDGRWIAYASNETAGVTNVFVRPFPAVDTAQWQVTTTGGSVPTWSKDGRELICAMTQPGGPPSLAAFPVPVIPAGASFTTGKPEVLFSMVPYYSFVGRTYDISRDGRFLLLKTGAATTLHPSITVVSHWVDELRARVTAK